MTPEEEARITAVNLSIRTAKELVRQSYQLMEQTIELVRQSRALPNVYQISRDLNLFLSMYEKGLRRSLND